MALVLEKQSQRTWGINDVASRNNLNNDNTTCPDFGARAKFLQNDYLPQAIMSTSIEMLKERPLMDLTKLNFDANEMLDGLQKWVLCESPSFDRTAVNRICLLYTSPSPRD